MAKGELNYEAPEWSIQQIRRASGLIEDICDCGVGHPNKAFLDTVKDAKRREGLSVHGCCGCCCYGKPLEIEHVPVKPKKCYEPNHCIACKKQVDSQEHWPLDALIFEATGNYGSSIFDPMGNDKWLRVVICDACIVENQDKVRMVENLTVPELEVKEFDIDASRNA